jgi:lipid-A-disaccharide synthase
MPPLVWFNPGETSGDLHAALLLKALRQTIPGLRGLGMAGPELLAAGLEPVAAISELSVMGFTEVLGQLPRILGLLSRIKKTLRERRPDAVILVDAPDFNFRVAKMAHALGIPVFYYISPKLWAWRSGRVEFIRRYVRRMICIFPFEVEFYKKRGLDVEYVGNPILDCIDWARIGAIEPDPLRIGFMPGSRRKEIRSLTPQFGIAARLLRERFPKLGFTLLRAPSVSEEDIRALWPADAPVTILPPEGRYEQMRACALLIAASGTATFEAALLGTPTVVAYKLSALTFALARRFVRVNYISLSNIILNAPIFPELLQHDADGPSLARQAGAWIEDPQALATVRERLAPLHALLGRRGAPLRAAQAIAREMGWGGGSLIP